MSDLPRVAIVGRPNVGKSTLFNRITRKRKAIVHEMPGVTRDIQRLPTDWNGVPFEVIDTGGLFSGVDDPLIREVEEKALHEALNADALIMVTDAQTGLTPVDSMIAQELRNTNLPVFVVANKVEKAGAAGSEFFALGFGDVYEISALHGLGTGDLLDDVVAVLPKRALADASDELRIAVVGRPNVGKSSLINRLLGKEVNIVDERPGTTRDSIDLRLKWHNRNLLIVDTAGIKRRTQTKDGVSTLSTLKSLEAIERADVVVIMLDATLALSNQDVKVGSYAHKEGKGVIICVNKWDLVEKGNKTSNEFERAIRGRFKFLSYAPVLFISAVSGQRTSKILSILWEIKEARETRIATHELNKYIESVTAFTPPPSHAGGTGKIYYATQTDVAPPNFTLFVNKRAYFDRSYIRFINNKLREKYSFMGTLIRINLVGKKKRG
ncbi:MAG: ribosome biogenesis GTPase Der [Chitinivibrionia bacterium]|nr:ribosome biogenesis GTPase Der [Chitinivibrionia bacterium]